MWRIRHIILILFLLLSISVVSQTQIVWRPETSLSERLMDRVPVSGRSIVGLVLVPPNGLGDASGFARVAMRAPISSSGEACFRAVSQDGRYEAQGTFRVVAGVQEWAPVEWRSSYADFLATRRLREIAILASLEPCSQRPATLLPVQIGNSSNALLALVNTRGSRPAAVLRREGDNTQHRARCRLTDSVPRLAYDFECFFGSVGAGNYQLILQAQSLDGAAWEHLEVLRVQIPALP